MSMQNQEVKIVYSLKMHIALQRQGFQHLLEMKNPNNPRFNCWVYEATEEFLVAFDTFIKESDNRG